MSWEQPPSVAVTRAFGVTELPVPMPGGQGTCWVAGNVVFKPGSGPLQEWLSIALSQVTARGIRLATPIPTRNGTWSLQGWSATHWVEGTEPDYTDPMTWHHILYAGRAFHEAIRDLPRPEFLDARQDPWALADRAAWGEHDVHYQPEFTDVAQRLKAALRPLGASQIVHGDLTRNILFATGAAPAVIDISPYWRPPAFAEGVVIADALCWHGAKASLLDDVGVTVPAVARALLFRMATSNERFTGTGAANRQEEAHVYAQAATAIGL